MLGKFQKIILNTFLILGIVFFSIITYSLISEGVIFKKDKENITSLRLIEVRVIKNDYANQSLVDSIERIERSETYQRVNISTNDYFLIKSTEGNLKYAKSGYFNLMTLSAPETIDFYKNPKIPTSLLNQNFAFGIYSDEKIKVAFPEINFEKELKLSSKKDESSEQKEIIIESTDKKVSLFLVIELNVSTTIVS